jgi:hypothetical protein
MEARTDQLPRWRQFATLGGLLPLTLPGDASDGAVREVLARHLEVLPWQLHLFPASQPGEPESVVVAASFALHCAGCGLKLECSCDSAESLCACVAAQALQAEDYHLCELCLYTEDRSHRCGRRDCLVCYEAGDESAAAGRPRRRPRGFRRSAPRSPSWRGPGFLPEYDDEDDNASVGRRS